MFTRKVSARKENTMKRVFYNQVTGEKIALNPVTDALAVWAIRHMDAWVEL